MASEKLEMEIVGKNSTGKGWDKVETEAKRRAKKIRDALARDGGLVGNAGGSGGGGGGKGGMFANMRKGFQAGQGQGIGALLPGGGLAGIALAGAGIGAIAMGVAKLAGAANTYANSIANIADNVNVPMSSAQNLIYLGRTYDVTGDQIQAALLRIGKSQTEASRSDNLQAALERLKIPLKEFITMRPDEAYSRLGKALKETGDSASVFEIVGKAGMRQVGFMKSIAGGIDDIGLASDQNINAVDNFFDRIEQGWIRAKAATTNKMGQLIRGDVTAFMGMPEQEKQQTAAEQIQAQNEQIRKEKATDEALARNKERKDLKDQIEEKKVIVDQGEEDIFNKQNRKDAEEEALNAKKNRGHLERNAMAWAGLQDMTAEQQAADDLKRGFNRGYDKQQSHAERDAKRMERRMAAREKLLENKNLKGPWIEKMRKVFNKAHDMAGKRDFVEDYNKVIATMSKEQRDILRQIQKDTKALQKLDAAFTMGGAQEAEGG
jgi:hypothetical protein